MVTQNEKILAFAHDFRKGKRAMAQSAHWRLFYDPDDVSGDKLTIEAISPDYTVSSMLKLLTDAISQIEQESYQGTK